PDLNNDMHDGSPAQADLWLKANLSAYAKWCRTPSHNSLLIIQWDEDDNKTSANQIPTIFYGAQVRPGKYQERVDHYGVLRTLLEMYGLKPLGKSAEARPLTDILKR